MHANTTTIPVSFLEKKINNLGQSFIPIYKRGGEEELSSLSQSYTKLQFGIF